MGSTFIDITGQAFNELTAVKCLDTKSRIWLWKCSCGKECTARKNDVTLGKKKSCGHLSNRGGAAINIGDKFGEWTVIKDVGDRHFLCRCSCGVERSIHSYDLRKGKSKSCGHISKGTAANGRKDTDKQTKLLELIKSKLTTPDTILYARNTELKQVSYSEAEEFLNKYHLQGNAPATIKLGLYNDKELVSILTFGAPRFNNNYTYEIIRYCNKFGVGVVGGIERLYKYFITTYSPESVITYSDISKFTGNVYSKTGFKATQPEPLTEPGYVWINNETGLVMQRYKTQKQKLLKLGLGTKEQTGKEIMVDNGFIQVYNCGNIKMEWVNENKQQ